MLLSCTDLSEHTYAIKDFNVLLQPYLKNIVSVNIVRFNHNTEAIKKLATKDDLIKLSKAENPVLRAIAFYLMLDTALFNHFDLIMNNLDDTSIVFVDEGEWGIKCKKVDDYIIENGKWKDSISKQMTIDALLKHHNNLNSAYYGLRDVQAKEEYYSIINQMALRESKERYFVSYLTYGFKEREEALFALAKYKKPADIDIIKNILLENTYQMSSTSFAIIINYPNDAYMEILEKYFHNSFYQKLRTDGLNDYTIERYIHAVAALKNERSASILDSILNNKKRLTWTTDTNGLRRIIEDEIWKSSADAFLHLKNEVAENVIKREEKNTKYTYPMDITDQQLIKDTSAEPIRW